MCLCSVYVPMQSMRADTGEKQQVSADNAADSSLRSQQQVCVVYVYYVNRRPCNVVVLCITSHDSMSRVSRCDSCH